MREWWVFCLDRALPDACMCVCAFGSYKRDRAKEWMRQQMNVCVYECGWSCETRGAWPWRFSIASGSELLKAAGAAWMKSQYGEMRKNYTERGKQCPAETCWGAVDGPGCSPLQSNSFTRGNIHGSAVSPNKVSIDLNSWTTKARPERWGRRS